MGHKRRATGRAAEGEGESARITCCAWCRRVRIEDTWFGGFVAAAFAEQRRALSHGICPDCFGQVAPNAAYP